MSTATELLRRLLEICNPEDWDTDSNFDELLADIRAFLAPEPESEPGCTRSHPHEDMSKECELRAEIAKLRNELANTNPSPARKPMTDREIMDLAKSLGFNDITTMDFAIGFRYAEKHHFGIGANQSDSDSIDLQSRCRGDKL